MSQKLIDEVQRLNSVIIEKNQEVDVLNVDIQSYKERLNQETKDREKIFD